MRRSASQVIRELEMRVARLERQASFGHISKSSSHNKRAFLSDLVSKVSEIYAKLKSDLPSEKEKNKILAKVASDLESEITSSIGSYRDRNWAGKPKSRVKCSIRSNQLVINIAVEATDKRSISLQISEMSDLKDLRDLVSSLESEYEKDSWSRMQSSLRVPFKVWGMILSIITKTLEKPLFLPMLQGDLATLSERVSAPLKKEYEKKFWEKLDKFSSVSSKVLKTLAKVGVGALVIGLCLSVFMTLPWGVVAGGIAGLFKVIVLTLSYGAAGLLAIFGWSFAMNPNKYLNQREASSEVEIPSDPEERLEMFLELLEQEGVA